MRLLLAPAARYADEVPVVLHAAEVENAHDVPVVRRIPAHERDDGVGLVIVREPLEAGGFGIALVQCAERAPEAITVHHELRHARVAAVHDVPVE